MRRTLAILAQQPWPCRRSPSRPLPRQQDHGGGASFPYVFLSQCAADFNASQNNFGINYTSTGSGTGKANFTKGPFVYGHDRQQVLVRRAVRDWEYIPAIGGAIAFPINLKNATTGRTLGSSIQLKQTTLAKIFSGNLKTWRHPEIQKDNPRIATALPATPSRSPTAPTTRAPRTTSSST